MQCIPCPRCGSTGHSNCTLPGPPQAMSLAPYHPANVLPATSSTPYQPTGMLPAGPPPQPAALQSLLYSQGHFEPGPHLNGPAPAPSAYPLPLHPLLPYPPQYPPSVPPMPPPPGSLQASSSSRSGKRGPERATDDHTSTSTAKRRRTYDVTAPVSTSAIAGVGPLRLVDTPLPEHVPESFASVSSRLSGVEDNTNGAREVWYFFRPLATKEEPAEKPASDSEVTIYAKPKTPYVGCKLCR